MITTDKKKYKDIKLMICINCGNIGHDYKHCNEPITSWGVVLVKLDKNTHANKNEIDLEKYDLLEGVELFDTNPRENIKNFGIFSNIIKFLLVRRKHSLGYVEFIRGRYTEDNVDDIHNLFKQMTPNEIQNIGSFDFDKIWTEFWGNDAKKLSLNKDEYINSKKKFTALKTKTGVELDLNFYVKNFKSVYPSLEWGFPKGRKMKGESDLECAIREFVEETSISEKSIKIITNVKPIIENMIGTNGVNYRHIYYLAEYIDSNCVLTFSENNLEIGNIGFFDYNSTISLLREYHIAKRNIVKNVFLYYFEMFISKNKNIDEIQKESTSSTWNIDNDIF